MNTQRAKQPDNRPALVNRAAANKAGVNRAAADKVAVNRAAANRVAAQSGVVR